MADSSLRIALGGGNLAEYPEGGGHWSAFVQYLLGLRELGHDALWIETLDRRAGWENKLQAFFHLMGSLGLAEHVAVLVHEEGAQPDLPSAECYGRSARELATFCQSADLLWNFVASIRGPLLERFSRRVFIDLDPGILQLSASEVEMGLDAHDAFLTVGALVGQDGCDVPTLGHKWTGFLPVVHCASWPVTPTPPGAALTSVTQWNWDSLSHRGNLVSASKRDAFVAYVDLPLRVGIRTQLAANIHPKDNTGDRELLLRNGWDLVDPHVVAGTPQAYADFIRTSYAEFGCVKPIYRALHTGWLSDRSAAYLASGRPVIAESTGYDEAIATGTGLLPFKDMEEAVEALATLEASYAEHADAARQLALDRLDTRQQLPRMLDAGL